MTDTPQPDSTRAEERCPTCGSDDPKARRAGVSSAKGYCSCYNTSGCPREDDCVDDDTVRCPDPFHATPTPREDTRLLSAEEALPPDVWADIELLRDLCYTYGGEPYQRGNAALNRLEARLRSALLAKPEVSEDVDEARLKLDLLFTLTPLNDSDARRCYDFLQEHLDADATLRDEFTSLRSEVAVKDVMLNDISTCAESLSNEVESENEEPPCYNGSLQCDVINGCGCLWLRKLNLDDALTQARKEVE